MRTHIDTTSLPAGRRLSYWREAVCANLVGVECEANPFMGLNGQFTQIQSRDGHVIARLRAEAHQASREGRQLQRSGTDFYMLYLQCSGEMRIERDGGTFTVQPGGIYFYDGATEHRQIFASVFDHLVIRMPRRLIEQKFRAIVELGSFSVAPSDSMIDKVLTPMASAALGAENYRALPAVVDAIFDLFAVRVFETEPAWLAVDGRPRLVLARVLREIERTLDDPETCAEIVAGTLNLSRRALDRALAQSGTSFPVLLIERRLRKAAALLDQADQRAQTITEIALACGFENHSFFSRRFRDRYGCSPRDYRLAKMGPDRLARSR